MDTQNDIFVRDWSADFIKKMQNRILVSHYKLRLDEKYIPRTGAGRQRD